jgi:hypothetical protein
MAKIARRIAGDGGVLVTALLLLCFCAVTCLPHLGHQHSQGQSCAICYAGALPFLQPGLSAVFAALFLVFWFHRSAGLTSPREFILAACSSRAPPE